MSITVTHLRQAEIGLRRGVDIDETMPATRRKESDGTAVLGCGFQVCGQFSFQSQRKAMQRMRKLLHNCTHLTRY